MYRKGPSDAELGRLGLLREDVEDRSTQEVWPEHWLAFRVFCDLSDQWYQGMSGPTGMNYSSFDLWFGINGGKPGKRTETIRYVQALVRAAMKQMAEDSKGD